MWLDSLIAFLQENGIPGTTYDDLEEEATIIENIDRSMAIFMLFYLKSK
jgi:hypothetical protein